MSLSLKQAAERIVEVFDKIDTDLDTIHPELAEALQDLRNHLARANMTMEEQKALYLEKVRKTSTPKE